MPRRVTALANQKGGVGKTTTAINLSACLAECGRKTLLVDLDPQANATSGLGIRPEPGSSLYGVLIGEGTAIERIQNTAVENLDLIPSEVDLAGAEIDIARADQYLTRFREALGPVLEMDAYEHIIIDCPPSLGILTVNAMVAASSVIIPIQCEYYALEGLSVISKIVTQLRQSGANPALKLEGILMTMFDARTNLSQQVMHEVRQHFADQVYEAVIPRTVRLSEAPSHGLPIVLYDSRGAGAEAYRQFTQEFLRRREQEAAKGSSAAGAEKTAPPTTADNAAGAMQNAAKEETVDRV